jgi:hypothetical protein
MHDDPSRAGLEPTKSVGVSRKGHTTGVKLVAFGKA